MPITGTNHIYDAGVRLFKGFMSNYWYPFLTRRLDSEDLVFLNYGYEEDPPMGLSLAEADEPDRYCIQLYHRVATQVDLDGKRVLEISCGHGGGASYLMRALRPASYIGLDFNPDGIAFCRKRYDLPGLEFVHGDAEHLPFDGDSFDAVINVEASHAYPNLARFLDEVARVLRPAGHFLYADFRGYKEFPGWDATLDNAPFRQVSQHVINAEVVRALEKNAQHRLELISRQMPAIARPFGRRFAGVPGTGLYRDIQNGKIEYRVYCFTKD